MFGLKSGDVRLITEVLARHREIDEALIFGSRAMGNYKPGSDVDIALKGQLGSESAIEISIELNERLPLPYRFDVVAYPSISEKALIEHIDHYGKVLYQRPKAN